MSEIMASDTQAIVTCHRSAPWWAGHSPLLAFGKANIEMGTGICRTASVSLFKIEKRAIIVIQLLCFPASSLYTLPFPSFIGTCRPSRS